MIDQNTFVNSFCVLKIYAVWALLLIAFQYNIIVSELKMYELKSFEVLMVCQQLVLTTFRYPNLSEKAIMGQRQEKYHSTSSTITTGHLPSSQVPQLEGNVEYMEQNN